MAKKVQTITKVIECPNPRCPSRTLNPLGFQVVFKKFQNQYMVLCPYCGNPIHYSNRWNFVFVDKRDYHSKRKKLYEKTPSGIASKKRYRQSPKGKAMRKRTEKKYRQSPKGKLTQKRHQKKYEQSPEGKATRKRHDQTSKGKTTKKKANEKYRKSNKGKLANRRGSKKHYHRIHPNARCYAP